MCSYFVIKSHIAILHTIYVFKGSEMTIDFSAYDDVSNAFVALRMCQKTVATASSELFRTIRNSCACSLS